MRHAGRSENVPVSAFNGVLVAHDQCGNHSRQLPVIDPLKNRLPDVLAGSLYRLGPGLCQIRQFFRRCVAFAGSHIARGLKALLPQPQLVVKAMRITVAMRRFQAHRHLPVLASA